MEEIKKFMISGGGYLHHIGMLTNDTTDTLESLQRLPGMGEWTSGESLWSSGEMVTGAPCAMICSTARILDSILLEVIEPVKGKSEGTHFAEYLGAHGPGLHHLCYGFPHYEDFLEVCGYLERNGCREVTRGRKRTADGRITDEFCYYEIKEGQLYLEVCLTRYKWGY